MWAKCHIGEGSADVNDAIVPPQTTGIVTTGVSKNGANNTGVSDDLSIAKIDTIAKSRSQYSVSANNTGVSDDLYIAKIDTIAKSRSQYSARDQNKADVVRRWISK